MHIRRLGKQSTTCWTFKRLKGIKGWAFLSHPQREWVPGLSFWAEVQEAISGMAVKISKTEGIHEFTISWKNLGSQLLDEKCVILMNFFPSDHYMDTWESKTSIHWMLLTGSMSWVFLLNDSARHYTSVSTPLMPSQNLNDLWCPTFPVIRILCVWSFEGRYMGHYYKVMTYWRILNSRGTFRKWEYMCCSSLQEDCWETLGLH